MRKGEVVMRTKFAILLISAIVVAGCSKTAQPTKVDSKAQVESLIEEGKNLSANGAHDLAIAKLKQAIAIDDKNIIALKLIRSSYLSKGDNTNAAEYAGILATNGSNDKENYAILAGYNAEIKNISNTDKYIKLYINSGGDRSSAESYLTKLLFSKSSITATDIEKQLVKEHLDELLKR